MKVSVVGVGMGNPDLLTIQARRAIGKSECLIGARRMLDCFPGSGAERVEAVSAAKIAEAVFTRDGSVRHVSVLVSGDVGFYSMARGLARPLENMDVEYLPGVSSLQYFCAKLGTAWDDARVLSLHGRAGNLPAAVGAYPKVFALTGGEQDAAALCRALCAHGLGRVTVWVGERLSYPDERITSGRAEELAEREFAPLSVLLVQNARAQLPPPTHGLPDEAFLRGDAPMTKAQVRAASVAALRLQRGWTVWDVGAGTGSVSVEIARVLPDGMVCAVERDPVALELLRQNRMRFNLHNLEIVEGNAPLALGPLPAPDAVFVGGSSGGMARILALALERNPKARIVANAITIETASAVIDCFNRHALPNQEVVQLSCARAKTVGGNHMMLAQNPVYILSAGGETDAGV